MVDLVLATAMEHLTGEPRYVRPERAFEPDHLLDDGVLNRWPAILRVSIAAFIDRATDPAGTFAFQRLPGERPSKPLLNIFLVPFKGPKDLKVLLPSVLAAIDTKLSHRFVLTNVVVEWPGPRRR